jgi:hypothetical protein
VQTHCVRVHLKSVKEVSKSGQITEGIWYAISLFNAPLGNFNP